MSGKLNFLTTEMATRENIENWGGLSSCILPDPDPILRKRGDDAEILGHLAADGQVATAMLSRTNRVLNKRNYRFVPGQIIGQSQSPLSQKLCNGLVKDLENSRFIDILSAIMEAPFYGYSVLEIIWRLENGWYHIDRVEAKPRSWFLFNKQNKLMLKGQNIFDFQEIPFGKFILARHMASYDNPYGLRLLSRCLWPVSFKKGGTVFYTSFVEKYGQPWAIGTAPSGANQEEKEKMLSGLELMVQNSVAVIPYGSEVKFLESSSGKSEFHESFLRRWDAEISKILMGQTLTAEINGGGSYAAAKTHAEVSDEYALADQHLVVDVLNELAWVYGQVNVGCHEMPPLFEYLENKDLVIMAELDNKLHNLGVRFKKKHFVENYSLAEDCFDVETNYSGSNFSAPIESKNKKLVDIEEMLAEDQTQIDSIIKKHLPDIAKLNADFISQVEKSLEAAETWDEAANILNKLLNEDLNNDSLDILLADLMFNANLAGRFTESKKCHLFKE